MKLLSRELRLRDSLSIKVHGREMIQEHCQDVWSSGTGGEPCHRMAPSKTTSFGLKVSATNVSHKTATVSACSDDPFSNPVIPDLSKYRAIVQDLAQKKIPGTSLDSESVESIASALYMAGIDSSEQALAMNLGFIPPGPLFHTWYPLHGTTLFDGRNNPEKFDYVSLAIEEAHFLEEYNLPLLFIHSTHGLDSSQTAHMKALFHEQRNILNLHIESDFKGEYLDLKPGTIAYGVRRMDSLRFCSLLDSDHVLTVALKKAEQDQKLALADKLKALGSQSLTYLDFDTTAIRPSLYELVPQPGFVFSDTPNFFYDVDRSLIPALPDEVQPKARIIESYVHHILNKDKQLKIDRSEIRIQNDKLHTALLDGRIIGEYQAITRDQKGLTWVAGLSYLRFGRTVTQGADLQTLKEHPSPAAACQVHEIPKRSDRQKMKILTGMQHLRMIHDGFDHSWCMYNRS